MKRKVILISVFICIVLTSGIFIGWRLWPTEIQDDTPSGARLVMERKGALASNFFGSGKEEGFDYTLDFFRTNPVLIPVFKTY